MDELKLAVRRLTRRPGASIVSILTLACAIGAAAATWSLLSAALLRPLPVRDGGRLFVPGVQDSSGRFAGIARDGFVYTAIARIRGSGAFERLAAEWAPPLALLVQNNVQNNVQSNATPVRTTVGFATFDYFDLLGVRVALGRGFREEDDCRGAAPVAILTDGYWRTAFDGRADAIGRQLTVAGKSVTIVGVAQPPFRGLDVSRSTDLYLPFHVIGDIGPAVTNYFADPGHRSSPTSGVRMVGRLAEHITAAQAAARLASLDASTNASTSIYVLTPVQAAADGCRARGHGAIRAAARDHGAAAARDRLRHRRDAAADSDGGAARGTGALRRPRCVRAAPRDGHRDRGRAAVGRRCSGLDSDRVVAARRASSRSSCQEGSRSAGCSWGSTPGRWRRRSPQRWPPR